MYQRFEISSTFFFTINQCNDDDLMYFKNLLNGGDICLPEVKNGKRKEKR